MKPQIITHVILLFAVITVILFFVFASGGIADSEQFDNTPQEKISPDTGKSITTIISNLTQPAKAEITAEDLQRIPTVQGTVQSNGNGNSSEYEEVVLNSFLKAAEGFSGAGNGMETYTIDTFDLLTDPDFADQAFLGREKGVKASIVYSNPSCVLEDTYWGHLVDASSIAHEIYESPAGQDTGYVTVAYMFAEKDSPRFQASLTADRAETFEQEWSEDTYLSLPAWSAGTIYSSSDIVPYENMETSLPASWEIDKPSADAASSSDMADKYNNYLSRNDLKDLLGTYSTEIQNQIQTISTNSTSSDFSGMADASLQMMKKIIAIEDEIETLPIDPQYKNVADSFSEGLRNYQYASSDFWYGATFTDDDHVQTANSYIQKAYLNNNNALEALSMTTIDTEVLEIPNGNFFSDAMYQYENYQYQDSNKYNDISVKLSSHTCSNAYILKQDGEKEKNVAGYGYKYIFPVVEFHHLGYRGSGSSIITTPEADDFSITYNGEEYKSITPSPYVDNKLDTTTCVEPTRYPYYKMKLDRKEEFEGVLVFKVPEDFDPAKACLILDLGDTEAVWHMVPR